MADTKIGRFKRHDGTLEGLKGVVLFNPDGTAASIEVGEVVVEFPEGLASEEAQAEGNASLATIVEKLEEEGAIEVSLVAPNYEVVGASDTDEILGSTGAIGDTIDMLVVIPTATSLGAISIEDGSTNIEVYHGGTVGADLLPFHIVLGGIAATTATGWELTTGANMRVIAIGKQT